MRPFPEEILATWPTVCAVGDEYQIMIPVLKETVMWAEVGGEFYYDDSNGILRSSTQVHRITIPQAALDKSDAYTIHWRVVLERLPYRSKLTDNEYITIPFRHLAPDAQSIRMYQIADAHSNVDFPVAAGQFWGDKLDVLVMNGDVPNDCGSEQNIASVFQISGKLSKGQIPVLFSRGNHDLRGVLAEKYAENTPSSFGRTYYSSKIGPLWALILDCGEDKVDECIEYGHTICCHAFRLRETKYIQQVAASPDTEYAAPGVQYRLVIAHNPFTEVHHHPFDIEQDLYAGWCNILRESIHPQLMLCGHIHKTYVTMPGDPRDHHHQPCPVVVGSLPDYPSKRYIGTAIELTPGHAKIMFTDNNLQILETHELSL